MTAAETPYQDQDELEAMTADAKAQLTAEAVWRLDLRWLMKGPRGRRIVRYLLDMTGALDDPTIANNALEMARMLGSQTMGRNLFAMVIDECPQHFLTMLAERQPSDQ